MNNILKDYFNANCTYDEVDFERRYRMPLAVLNRVYERVETRPFFVRKSDGLGWLGIHQLQRVTAAQRMMALGLAADAVDEYVRISESSAMESLKDFCSDFVDEFGHEYLRCPTPADMERILRINAARGFPGMARSID